MNNQRVVYIRALTGCTDCPLVAFIGHSGTVYTLPEVLLVWEVHVTVRGAKSACSLHIPIYFWSATLLLMPESGSTSHAQVQHCSQSSQSSATHYIHTYILATQTPYKPNTQTVSLCIGPSKHRTYQVLPSVSLATLRQVIPASCAALFLIDESWCSHTYVCTPTVLFSVLYMYGTICVTVRGTSSHVQRLERTLFVSRE